VYTPPAQVAPPLVHEPPALVISELCHECDELLEKLAAQKELLDDATSKLEAADEAVCCNISMSILLVIKPIYLTTPIYICVGCSVEFYDALLKSRLPGWELTRSTLLIAEDALMYHLVALSEHPIYAIYSYI
jgi:hypothetical protein